MFHCAGLNAIPPKGTGNPGPANDYIGPMALKSGANPLPEVAAGWARLQAALARRGTTMPCGL